MAGPARTDAGFTFLELLLALAILGSTFTVLLSAHTSAGRVATEARRLFIASALAREVMVRTEVEGLPLFGRDSGDFGDAFPEYTWEREVTELQSTGAGGGGGFATVFAALKQVMVRVSWKEGGHPRSTELYFFDTDDAGTHHVDDSGTPPTDDSG